MNEHGTKLGPLQEILGRLLGREITEEELAETRRRLSQIAQVLAAIQARRDAARESGLAPDQPAPKIKTSSPGL